MSEFSPSTRCKPSAAIGVTAHANSPSQPLYGLKHRSQGTHCGPDRRCPTPEPRSEDLVQACTGPGQFCLEFRDATLCERTAKLQVADLEPGVGKWPFIVLDHRRLLFKTHFWPSCALHHILSVVSREALASHRSKRIPKNRITCNRLLGFETSRNPASSRVEITVGIRRSVSRTAARSTEWIRGGLGSSETGRETKQPRVPGRGDTNTTSICRSS